MLKLRKNAIFLDIIIFKPTIILFTICTCLHCKKYIEQSIFSFRKAHRLMVRDAESHAVVQGSNPP